MNRIAEFLKVSKNQFYEDYKKTLNYSDIDTNAWNNIKTPIRSTKGSAGYDFYLPIDIELKPQESLLIPTGIRAKMEEGWVLLCFPRSGLGMKYRLQLDNTVGVIDSDYFHSENEGHIMIPMTNDTKKNKTLILKKGERFAQCLFIQYGITIDDSCNKIRNGGFGSTDKLDR